MSDDNTDNEELILDFETFIKKKSKIFGTYTVRDWGKMPVGLFENCGGGPGGIKYWKSDECRMRRTGVGPYTVVVLETKEAELRRKEEEKVRKENKKKKRLEDAIPGAGLLVLEKRPKVDDAFKAIQKRQYEEKIRFYIEKKEAAIRQISKYENKLKALDD